MSYYFSAIVSTGESVFGGTSLFFDGDSYINAQGNREFNFGNNNFNIEMWLRPDQSTPSFGTTGAYGVIATTSNITDNRGFLLAINPNYTIHWAVGNAGTAWSYTANSTRSIAASSWSHISLTREKDIIALYINGELENFRNVSGLSLNNPSNNVQIGGRSLQNQYYRGYVDELRITTGISRYSKFNTDYQFYTNEDPFYHQTSLLLDYQNNSVQDISLNKNTCTISGDAFISDLQKFLGKPSLILGAGTGYLKINSGSNSFDFGTGDFTIESWIHPINNQNSSYIPIIETRSGQLSNASFSLGINLVNNKYVLDFFPRAGNQSHLYSNNEIQFNAWSYITLTRKNGICNFFINGLKQTDTLQVTGTVSSETVSPIIGLSEDQYYFDGYINDFRITKACRYTDSFDYSRASLSEANVIDPYLKNTSLLLKFEISESGNLISLIDDSQYSLPISGSSGLFSIVQSGSKFGNACAEFSPSIPISSTGMSGGYISVPNSELFNFSGKDFTIEFWHKRKTGIITGNDSAESCCAGWYGRFFTTYCSGGGYNDPKDSYINYGGINILMEKNSTTGSVYLRNNGDNNYISGNLNMGFIPENWTYYTLMRMGSNISLFKSGILIDSLDAGTKHIFSNFSGVRHSPTINIGGTVEGYHSLNGFMDSFRITNGYARYPYMFTGRAESQKTDFITLQNENPFYENEIIALDTDINNKEKNNVKQISISENGAGKFNGSANLQIEPSSGFNFGTGNFTIEFWFKNLSPNNSGIIFKTSSGDEFSSVFIHLSGDNNLYSHFSFLGNQWDTFLNLGSAQTGVWNHFAVVKNTGVFYGYKNGTQRDAKNSTSQLYWNGNYPAIIGGQSGSKNIYGLLDEFRISTGLARYTESFTPKTKIETSANDDKYYYNNTLVIPFDGENNSTGISDLSIDTKEINNNNVTISNNIKFDYIIGQDDPYYNNVSLLLLFDPEISRAKRDGFLTDASKNNFTLTPYGNVIIDTSGYKVGGGAAFFSGDGSANYSSPPAGGPGANYIDVPPSVDFNYGTGDFTIEFWYKVTHSPSNTPNRRILAHPLSTSAANSLQIWHAGFGSCNRTQGAVGLAAQDSDCKIVDVRTGVSYGDGVNDGGWHHYAFSRVSGVSYCFMDGRFRDSGIDTTNYNRGETEGIRIGGRGDLNANTFLQRSYLDELRITKGIGRYIGITTGSGFIPQRLSNRYCIAKHHEDMIINSGDNFTIECWFKPLSTSSGTAIFSKGVSGDFALSGASDYVLKFDNDIISSGTEINITDRFIDSNTEPQKNREELRLGASKAGDLLIAVLLSRGGQPDAPNGWSLYGTYLASMPFNNRLYVFTKTATDTEPGTYYFTLNSNQRFAGCIARIEDGGIIDTVTLSYGNNTTATINTAANRLNLTVFTWIYAATVGTESYSQSAADGSLTQITDSPRVGARLSAGYTKNATTVTSTHSSANVAESPNHAGICIQIIPSKRPLSFYSLDVDNNNPLLKVLNISPKKWYHCAIVKDKNSTRMFINGVESSSSPITNWSATKTGDFYIGTSFENKLSGIFDGFIDGFKFTKNAKYKSNFNISRPENEIYFSTKPIIADKYYNNTVLSLEMESFDNDRKIVDNSIKNFNIINSGVNITSETSTFGRSSAIFYGSGFLAIENDPSFNIVNNDFTIECWANMSSINRLKYILRHQHLSGYGSGGWSFGIENNHRPFFSYGNGISEKIISGSQRIDENVWHHLAVCKNANKLYMYTDGTLTASSIIDDIANSGNSFLYIGTDPSSSALRTWSGYIDNLKIITGVCKYLPTFNTPNIGFVNVQKSDPHFNNVSLLMYGNNASGSSFFTDEARYGISRLNNGCAYFNGSSSFIMGLFGGIGDFGSGNFTIDMWIKPMQLPASGSVMGLMNKFPAFEISGYWSGLKNTSRFLSSDADPYLQDFNLRIYSDLGTQSASSPIFFSRWDAFNQTVRPSASATYYWLKNANSMNLMQLFQSPNIYVSRATWSDISGTYFNEYYPPNNNSYWRLYISGISDNEHRAYFAYKNSGIFKSSSSPAKINLYEWNHIAIVRTGSQIISYVNGVSGDALIEDDIIANSPSRLTIGRYDNASSNYYYNGFVEDTRITKNISRYNYNFSDNLPSKFGNSGEDLFYSDVELLMHFNGLHNLQYFKDDSINNYIISGNDTLIKLNNDIIRDGTAIINSSADSVFGGASIRGNGGSLSRLYIPSRYDFGNFKTDDFTIEWWDNISAWNSGYFPILHYGNDGDYDTAKSRVGIYYASSGTQLIISMSGNSQIFPVNRETLIWQHNAITRRNGIINLFINGNKHPSGFLMDYNITRGVNISTVAAGKYGPSLGTLYTINGFIDDLRVTKNIARYIEDFTPPTEQFANF